MARFRDGGGSEEFGALYEQARGPLLVWITSLGAGRRRRIDPLEVLQDTFVNIYRYAHGFRDEGPRSFRVWSRTIAGNLIRRERCVPRPSLQDLPEGLQEPADARSGPVEQLALDEDTRSVADAWLLLLARYVAAYEQLGPRDRAALEMIEVRGLCYADACRELRVGLSNLKMILFRARRRIRAAIARDLGQRASAAPRARRAG